MDFAVVEYGSVDELLRLLRIALLPLDSGGGDGNGTKSQSSYNFYEGCCCTTIIHHYK